MESLLRKIDMFGRPAKLRTFGEDSYKTAFGGILTLISFFTIAFFSYLFGTDFFHKENPRVVQNFKIHKKAGSYTLKTAKDPFMIRLNDGGLKVLDYATLPYKIQGFFYHFKKDAKGVFLVIFSADALVPCTQTKMNENKEIAENVVMSEWYCFDWDLVTELGRKELKDPNYEAQLMGTQEESEYTFFRMNVSNNRYDLKTQQISDISSLDELQKIKDIMVTVKYPSAYFDAEESDALQNIYKEELFEINPAQLYANRQYMKRLTIRDDTHWMLKKINADESLVPDELTTEYYPTNFVTRTTNNFYVKFFYISKKEEIATRSYMKAQELSAVVGDFVKIVVSNCYLVVHAYAGFYMVVFYLTSLYGTKNVVEDKPPVEISASVNNYTGDSPMIVATRSIRQVKLNIFSYYLHCFRRQSPERQEAVKAFQAAETYLKERLDVKYLLEHFEKFKTVCEMTLTTEQLEALNN